MMAFSGGLLAGFVLGILAAGAVLVAYALGRENREAGLDQPEELVPGDGLVRPRARVPRPAPRRPVR